MRKQFGTAGIAVLLTMALAGCGSSGSSSAQAAAVAASTSSTEAGTESGGKLTVGMSADYAPFDWLQTDDSNGAVMTTNGSYINGYDVLIAKKIAQDLNMDLAITQVDWNGLVMSVSSGQVDCAIAGMSITSERKQSVDFTDWYYQANTALVVSKDSAYADAKSLDDLAGGNFTSAQNTTWYAALDQLPDTAAKGAALETFASMISAVNSGIIDGFTCDVPSAESLLKTNPNLVIVDFDEGKGFQDDDEDVNLGIAVKKGNTELVDKINSVLKTMSDSDRDDLMQQAVAAEPANSME